MSNSANAFYCNAFLDNFDITEKGKTALIVTKKEISSVAKVSTPFEIFDYLLKKNDTDYDFSSNQFVIKNRYDNVLIFEFNEKFNRKVYAKITTIG